MGRKLKYGEPTKTVTVRLPLSLLASVVEWWGPGTSEAILKACAKQVGWTRKDLHGSDWIVKAIDALPEGGAVKAEGAPAGDSWSDGWPYNPDSWHGEVRVQAKGAPEVAVFDAALARLDANTKAKQDACEHVNLRKYHSSPGVYCADCKERLR